MPYQTPITIKAALDHIHRHEYVLPAIQREFVWRPDQISRLFDSLMRGYPVGSFLFWRVQRENVRDYRFYGFVSDYHQRDNPHCPPLDVPPDEAVVAVLDGQQRLTAFNIGLRGSHAIKEPRKWWDNPDAFPRKRLYLNVLAEADENDEGMRYNFAFLTEDRAMRRTEAEFWFVVAKIREMPELEEIYSYIVDHQLSENREVFRIISRLHKVVHTDLVITFYEEYSQDIEKVLNIFIRTNSGGTVLSYSDLLLSIATAQWEKLDARSEIHSLVDDLNDTRDGFALSKDFVLKAGLMLCDIASAQEQTKDSVVPGGARYASSLPAMPGHRQGESSERLCALVSGSRLKTSTGATWRSWRRTGVESPRRSVSLSASWPASASPPRL